MFNRELFLETQTSRCLLCENAPCSHACTSHLPVSEIIRSFRFENHMGAAEKVGNVSCMDCSNPVCMSACRRKKLDSAVEIPEVLEQIRRIGVAAKPEVDLTTTICGVRCENPFLLSSSVVGSDYEMVAKAFDMGWAGVAFKTIGLFVPEEVSPRFADMRKENTPYVGFKNIEQISDHTLEENMGYLKKLKENYPSKVIVASIMGRNEEVWTKLGALMEEAGADVVECNFSCPNMTEEGLGSDVGTHPELVAKYVKAVKRGTKLPVLAKMTPNITNMEIPAAAVMEAGAEGLAAINTIKSIMNVNLDDFSSAPSVAGKTAVGGYSGKAVKPIALRFIHDMAVSPLMDQPEISGMGGIETWRDAAEFIAMGCSTVQVTTAVMQYGYRIIEDMIDGLSRYLTEKGYHSVAEMQGKALSHIVGTDELDRSGISFPKFNRELCVGCGRCYISCYDGGHQAITIDSNRHPVLNGKKCVGCHLCLIICPAGAITPGKVFSKVRKMKAVDAEAEKEAV